MFLRWRFFLLAIAVLSGSQAFSQDEGQLSGDLQFNFNAFDYDSSIGATNPQYRHELTSAEAWLNLNYRYKGFTAIARFDLYNNSQLLNPGEVYTRQGLGFYQLTKDIQNFTVTAGHFYDQFGSGLTFRAYEERPIGIDYAIQGLRVHYHPNDSFFLKVFTGLEKNRFDVWPQVVKGANAEKILGLGKFPVLVGGSVVNRTLDNNTMVALAGIVNALPEQERYIPQYNAYAGSAYARLSLGEFSFFGEYAIKSPDVNFVQEGVEEPVLENNSGNALSTTLNYSHTGIGVILQYRQLHDFTFKTTPFSSPLQANVNYLPAFSRQHSYRLPARYSVAGQGQGERGYAIDLTYSPFDHHSFSSTGTYITDEKDAKLFSEFYLEYTGKLSKKVKVVGAVQKLFYDIEIYQAHPGDEPVDALAFVTEASVKVGQTRRKSIRTELQYLFTDQDKGDFGFALLEYNYAPHWSISVTDMVNTKPTEGDKIVHYYSALIATTWNQTRLTAGYVKQVEGVVCTGGVCRVEPAFSGFRGTLSTNF